MIDIAAIPTAQVHWRGAVRIIRSVYPPVDVFEDIADPADWPLLISVEQKTNPGLMDAIGNLDLVPLERRVGGYGSSYLMAPFTHVSKDRPSRFSDGSYRVLYAGSSFEVALLETVHHHARFMTRTNEPEGWTSQFREIILDVDATLHDLRERDPAYHEALQPNNCSESQRLGASLRAANASGIIYPSVQSPEGDCVGLFYPDLCSNPVQGRHLDYHWNGQRVDLWRDLSSSTVYRLLNK